MTPKHLAARANATMEEPMSPLEETPSRTAWKLSRARWIVLVLACVVAGASACKNADASKLQRLPPLPASGAPHAAPGSSGANAASPGQSASPATSAAPLLGTDGVIRLTGNTEAHRRSLVNVAGQGLLIKLAVREGDFLRKGELIAQLDSTQAGLTVRVAEAGLAVAKAQLRAAERERKRLEGLASQKAVPGMQVDQATSGFEMASAGVAASEAQVAQARKALADTTVRAPFAGIVGARVKGEGEWVSPMPPAPIIELVEVTPLDLQIQAPEHLLGRIMVGDEVTAHFNTVGRSTKAKVTRIVPIVRLPMRTFLVIAEIPNEDRSLSPGLFAEIQLIPTGRAAPKEGESSELPLSSKDGAPADGPKPAAREVAP
jgi:RND family efflux transporter MFP subunit